MNPRKFAKKLIPRSTFKRIAPLGHKAEASLAQLRMGHPSKGLRVITVTGSAGKTTTTTIIASILRAAGYKTAYFTTADNDFGDGNPVPNLTRMTTVPVGLLLQNIQKARQDHAIEFLVLETTAHALDQGRIQGIDYEMAVLTNFNHEHLDYFGTIEAYRAAKMKLFSGLQKTGGTAIINADDPSANYFLGLGPKDVTYGTQAAANVIGTDIKPAVDGSSFTIKSDTVSFSVTTHLPGSFNISNNLAAATACLQLGIKPEAIAAGIAGLSHVPGRMQTYKTDAGFTIVIDYAHTPDSFEKIFKELRPVTKGRLIPVFGCAGERDKGRRPLQGKLAADYCEVIILTEDDPRSEDDNQIFLEIQAGIAQSNNKPQVFTDLMREDAIDRAVLLAQKDDVILLLSKGPEQTIERADGPKPWDELGALQTALTAHNIKLIKA